MRRYLGSLVAVALAVAPASALAESEPPTDVARPRLGVQVTTLGSMLRTFFGSKDHSGVLVTRVEPLSPAARAGISPGDLLQEVEGTVIDEASDVPAALAKVPSERTVRVKLLRHHKPVTLDVKLERTATSVLDLLPARLRQLLEQAGAKST